MVMNVIGLRSCGAKIYSKMRTCSLYNIFALSLFLFILINPAAARAAEYPTKPILRVNTEMHTAPIKRIGVDADNRYIVTGSHDKTVKLWELSTGKLITTLRVPIDEGDGGKIYSIAISPDGKTIACGGNTGYESDQSANIYLFDRETRKIKQTITGLPNVISNLAYSKDGRFLVATLGGKNGIRIYETTND